MNLAFNSLHCHGRLRASKLVSLERFKLYKSENRHDRYPLIIVQDVGEHLSVE